MKRTVINRIIAAMLFGSMLIQNVPFAAFAEELAAAAEESEAVVTEEELPLPAYETAEPSTESAENLDFSSGRLLVCTEDEAVLASSVPTTILSGYEGVYLLNFDSEADTREAYYYYSTAAASAEPDIALYVADDAYLQKEAADASYADPLSRLSVLLGESTADESAHYDIALIDTGASADGVSVIGENALDDNGHAGRMYEVISEVSPALSVLSVKAFDSHGIGSIASVYAAIRYAVEKDVDVIDLSFAAESAADSPVLERTVSMAKEKGITVIGAAGNNHADAAAYIPGRVPGVTVVGACDDAGLAIPSSNYGEALFCNVAAQSTSEAAARLAAMVAAYGMEQVEAEMGNGIVFRYGEAAGNDAQDEAQPGEEVPSEAEASGSGLFDESELSEETLNIIRHGISAIAGDSEEEETIGYPDFNRNYPPEQEPVIGKGATIDHVYLRWLSSGESGSEAFGTLNLAPQTENAPNQQFQIDFDLSGQYPYEPGSVEITIPAYLWKDRDGEECGTLTLSVPEDPETGAEFAWKRVGDTIVITNVRTLPAATKVMLQGTFRSVDAREIVDDTTRSFQATVTVKTQDDSISMKSNDISAHMDTYIVASAADKTAYDGTTGKYTVWWGEVPPDMPEELLPSGMNVDEYLFVRWYVSGEAAGNQPFTMCVDDSIDGDYGGVLLGVSHCARITDDENSEDYVQTTDNGINYKAAVNNSVHAALYDGFSTLPQSAYVWTAYKISELGKDSEGNSVITTIPNKQTITVTGNDDHESSTMTDDAVIEIKEPTTYKFIKHWEDDDVDGKHRPESITINIYSRTLDKTTTITLTSKNADKDDLSNWVYEWTDNGQSQFFTVQEILNNAEGYEWEYYDENLHQFKWWYYLDTDDEDYKNGEDNQWYFPNVYTERWLDPGEATYGNISYINKNNVYAFSDYARISKRDGLSLNKLLHESDVYVPFTVETVVSAASKYLNNQKDETEFVLEDGEYYLDGTKLSIEEMDIGAVTFTAPKVYVYKEQAATEGVPDGNTWYEKERIVPPETTLYGLIGENWVPMAVWKPAPDAEALEDDLTEDAGSLESLIEGVSIEGSRIVLPEGVSQIRIRLSATAAFVKFECKPEIHIHASGETVQSMIQECYVDSEYSMLTLSNKANSYAAESVDDKAEDRYVNQYGSDTAYLHGKLYKVAADLNKIYTLTENDVTKKQIVLHAAIEMTQQSNILSLEEFRTAAASGEIPYSEGGTYYDLLPHGVEPDLNTITLTEGDRLINAYTISDYKNSNRTLLVVQVEFAENLIATYSSKYPKDPSYPTEGFRSSHVLEFDSYILQDIYSNDPEVDTTNFHNVAAFEAQENSIASIEGWQGEKNDPTGIYEEGTDSSGQHKRTSEAFADKENPEWMKGLGSARKSPSFVYAGANVKHEEIDVSAQSGLEKYVKAVGFGTWSTGVGKDEQVNVQEGGEYVYYLRVSAAKDNTKEIIVIDSLENFYPHPSDVLTEDIDGEGIRWHGYLESIDLSAVDAKGIEPTVYYYVDENGARPMVREYGTAKETQDIVNRLEQDENWTTEKPSDMSKVTAVAFDLRFKKDKTNFVLEQGDSIPIMLYMRAPDKTNSNGYYLNEDTPTNPDTNGHAYNEIYMSCTYSSASSTSYSYMYWDYTKVGIYSKDITVTKVWDDADDADGKRPTSVNVQLLANGEPVEGMTATLNEENDWTCTFERLLTYDENDRFIVYSVEETPVPEGYTLQTDLRYENGNMSFTLTNVHDPDKISIPVTKLWDFTDGGEDALPNSITFRLMIGDEETGYTDTGMTLTVKPDKDGNWHGEFTDLIEKSHGDKIKYVVVEDPVTDFIQTGSKVDKDSGYTFTNKYHPCGDLILTKIVENNTDKSKEYNLEKQIPFQFLLQLYTEDAENNRYPVINKYSYYIYDKTEHDPPLSLKEFIKAIEEGKVESAGKVGNGDKLSLLEGQQIVIKDLPTKVKYSLTELSRKAYELVGTVGDEGTIQSGYTVQAEFTNRYITNGTATIKATKLLTGRALRGYQFRFELRDKDGTLLRSANNNEKGDVTFNLSYTNKDDGITYTYYITEVQTDIPGYTLDPIKFMVKVTPHDKGDGTMECEIEYFDEDGDPIRIKVGKGKNAKEYDDPVFRNEYHASGKIKLVAWKALDGRILQAEEFTFHLYDEKGNLIQTKQNNAEGVITFDDLEFNEKHAGNTYCYFVREKKGADKTVVYDEHVICYMVKVIDNGDGTLSFSQSSYIMEEGHGLSKCSGCDGTGKVVDIVECNDCNGTGKQKIACETCAGDGEQEIECEDCNGTGEVEVDCDTCDGTGKQLIDCELCSGYGFIVDWNYVPATDDKDKLEIDCITCEGAEPQEETCTTCGGSGKLTVRKCKACGGTGVLITKTCACCGEISDQQEAACENCEETCMLDEDACEGCQSTLTSAFECTACDSKGWVFFEDIEPSTPVFSNGLAPGSLSVTKKVTELPDDEDAQNQEFTFHIRLVGDKIEKGMEFKDADGNIYVVDASGELLRKSGGGTEEEEVQTAAITLKIGETLTFKDIPAGTSYQVWEEDEAGWYLADSENSSGLIEARKTAKAKLTNEFDPTQTVAVIVGTKLLDNRPAYQFKDQTFKFDIFELVEPTTEESEDEGSEDEETDTEEHEDETAGLVEKYVDTVEATAGGFIQKEFTYKEPGTHTYIIREVVDETNDEIVYDKHVEKIIVKVEKIFTDNDTSKSEEDRDFYLKATVTYVDSDGDDTPGVVRFENYTAPGALQISKVGNGVNDSNNNWFTFEVSFYNENGVPISDGDLEWYRVDKDGMDIPAEPVEDDTQPETDDDEPAEARVRKIIVNRNGFVRTFGNDKETRQAPQRALGKISALVKAEETEEYTPPDIPELNTANAVTSGANGTVNWYIIPTDRTVKSGSNTVTEYVLLFKPASGKDTGVFTTGYSTNDNNNGFKWLKDKHYKDVTTILTQGELSMGSVKDAQSMFNNCTNLVYANLSGIDLSYNGGADGNLYKLFEQCQNLVTVDFGEKPIKGRYGLYYLFDGCTRLTTVNGLVLEYTGTQQVNLEGMFRNCSVLTSIELTNWKILGGATLKAPNLFASCPVLQNIDMSGWNVEANGEISLASLFNSKSSILTVALNGWEFSGTGSLNLTQTFYGCSNMTTADLSNWTFSDGITVNLDRTFMNCGKATRIDFSGWNNIRISRVTDDAGGTFTSCTSLPSLDVSGWNTSEVTNFRSLFDNCIVLATITGIEHLDTSSATSMRQMFMKCRGLTSLNLSNWDVSKVKTMQSMFNMDQDGSKLTSINFDNWKTESLENMQEMFQRCRALTELDLSHFKTSKLTTMRSTFNYCTVLTTLDISNWDTGNVESMYETFARCWVLPEITGIEDIRTGKVNTMQYTFLECRALTTLDLTGWDTRQVTTMESMFNMNSTGSQLTALYLNGEYWDTSQVTTMQRMFSFCEKLTTLDVSHFKPSSCMNMSYMFNYCRELPALDVGGWDTGNVTTMQSMFAVCWKLKELKGIGNLDTSKVTTMQSLFQECRVLEGIDLSNWDTGEVTTMQSLFLECRALEKLDLSRWNTSKVEKMRDMFKMGESTDSRLKYLDLSGWDTSKVTDMNGMFYKCLALEILDIGKFNTQSVTDAANMFASCDKIKEITLNKDFFNSGNVLTAVTSRPAGPVKQLWVLKVNLNEVEPHYSSVFAEIKEDPALTNSAATYVWDTLSYYTVHFVPGADTYTGSMTDGRSAPDADFVLPVNQYSRYGYLFTGWLDENTGNTFMPGDDRKSVIPENTYENGDKITLTAQWVKYDADKGFPYYVNVYMENPDYKEDDPSSPPKYTLAYSVLRYIENFTGMATVTLPDDSFNDVRYYRIPEQREYEINEKYGLVSVDLYYDLKCFTIGFVGNGGKDDVITGSTDSIIMIGAEEHTLVNGFINGSKRFIGWNTQPDGTGKTFGAGSSYTTEDFECSQGGKLLLYAMWADNSTTITPTAGKITVRCKAGETIVFPNLPAGTTYTVKEIDIPSGWQWESFDGDGELTEDGEVKGTIISNSYVKIQEINSYSATGGAILEAHKQLDGDTLQSGDFEFELLQLSDPEILRTDNYGEDGEFSGLYAQHDDTDDIVTIEGSNRLYVVLNYNTDTDTDASVQVEANGELIEKLTGSGNKTYVIAGNSVTVKAVGNGGVSDYYVRVYEIRTIDTALNGLLDQREVIIGQNDNIVENEWYNTGLVTFATQSYTEPGEYVYYIHEKNTRENSIIYDEHIVKAVVTLTDNGDGSLAASVAYYDLDDAGNAEQAAGAKFVNRKKTGQLSLSKKLIDASGGTVSDTEFTFTIYLKDASGNPISGTFELVEGDYTEPIEEDPEKPPDTTETTETTEATESTAPYEAKPSSIRFEDGVGELTIRGGEKFTIVGLPDGATYTVEETELTYFEQTDASGTEGTIEGGSTSAVLITNTYSVTAGFELTAYKNFIGGDLSQYDFEFVLLDHAHKEVTTVKCGSDGVIRFTDLEFTEADIGRDVNFYIREIKGTDSNIQYDTNEQQIVIHVAKASDNSLILTPYVKNPDTGEFNLPYTQKEQLTFTNILQYDLTVSKSVTGTFGDLMKEFEFVLTLTNGEDVLPDGMHWTKGSETGALILSENGKYKFTLRNGETITFTGLIAGMGYTITEANDADYTAEITVIGDTSAVVEGNTVSGTLRANVIAAYLNTCQIDADLPGAGWFGGTKWLYTLGTVIVLSGLLQAVLYVRRRRRTD